MDINGLGTKLAQTKSLASAPWLFGPLLNLLALGEPVTIGDLASATDRSVDQVRDTLSTIPDIELDDQGDIVGYGLSLRPTPHHFEINGREFYTWCALDTLIFPALLNRTAQIESPCHSTGTPIRVTAGPTGVTNVEPATAVVSVVIPTENISIRAAFCDQVHFFASPEVAGGWLEEHPGMAVLPIQEAYKLGQSLVKPQLEDQRMDSGCC